MDRILSIGMGVPVSGKASMNITISSPLNPDKMHNLGKDLAICRWQKKVNKGSYKCNLRHQVIGNVEYWSVRIMFSKYELYTIQGREYVCFINIQFQKLWHVQSIKK